MKADASTHRPTIKGFFIQEQNKSPYPRYVSHEHGVDQPVMAWAIGRMFVQNTNYHLSTGTVHMPKGSVLYLEHLVAHAGVLDEEVFE